MKLAISPCPNDTYLFYAWIHRLVGQDFPIEPIFADIQHLNEWALKKKFPLIKISLAVLPKILSDYQLLPIGTALGFQCGPKLVSKHFFSLADLSAKKLAIPGEHTTAHFLFNHLFSQPKQKIFCLYNEVGPLLESDEADCGLIIHESRFTFKKQGYLEIADLGQIWHNQTGLPLPLGGLAIARETPDSIKKKIISILHASLAFAKTHIDQQLPFITQHSQEKDAQCIRQHIETYVTSETEQISELGILAIEKLFFSNNPNYLVYV